MLPAHPHRAGSGQYFQFCKYSRWVLGRCWGLAMPLVLSSAWHHQSSLCSSGSSANPDRNTPGWGWVGLCEGCVWVQGGQRGNSPRFCSSHSAFPIPASPGLCERGKYGELLAQPLGFAVIRSKTSSSPFCVPVPPGEELVPNFPRGWHLPWMSRAESGPCEGVCVSGWK